VIELVGHPLLLCCISLDVNDITNTVGNQVCREFNWAMFCDKVSFSRRQRVQRYCKRTFEAPLEHMARARPITEGVRHFEYYPLLSLQQTDRAIKTRTIADEEAGVC
jgi:hypothetical protein